MDTNSNIPPEKKVVSVEILHLDQLGYGPKGKHTRRAWRAECLENLFAGYEQFEAWQKSWEEPRIPESTFFPVYAEHTAKLNYDDGTQVTVLGGDFESNRATALDFVGHVFDACIFFDAVFLSSALFNGAVFSGSQHFDEATFCSDAYFSNAIFCSDVHFAKTTFTGLADFSSVNFSGRADFSNAIFTGDAKFCNASFYMYADFPAAKFSQVSDFSKCIFFSCSSFQYAVFDFVARFEEAVFVDAIPRFRGCKIETTRVEFSDDSYFPKNENTEDAIRNISFLKRLSDEHGQTDQALNFNAIELRAKALLPDAGFWFKWFTFAYEIVSDFGRSFTKPLKFYIRLLLITLFLASAHAVYYTNKECKNEYATFLRETLHKSTHHQLKPATDPVKYKA
jgi:uncharacterized protein YjbI with pentapeptide repeats